jgi:TetR/AcrR family transcriptional regulator
MRRRIESTKAIGPAYRDTPGARRVLDAAVQAFARRGFDGAGLRLIAGEAGVDAALIVHAFGSKARLWQACVDEVADELLRALGGEGKRPCASLEEAVDRLLDAVCGHPVSVQFILSEIVRQDERFDYVYARLVEPIHDLLHAAAGSPGTAVPRDEIPLLALSGAIATTVVARSFMVRKGLLPDDEARFRADLRKAVEALVRAPQIN